MRPGKSRSVYRYFDPADSFVRILICDGGNFELPTPPGLNRAGYRRLVIETCMPEFADDLVEQLDRLFPDDPLLAEDLLYQLCTEVNPGLDINTVRLRGEEPQTEQRTKGRNRPDDSYEGYLQQLGRRVKRLHGRLSKHIVGQDHAIESAVSVVQKAAAGLAVTERPMGSFLLVGRTGTGKTEFARTLAEELFSDGTFKGLVRIDCSEFALAHEYSKLIGAPPGYIGHEDGGQLTDLVAKHPECVVLFDEIEKAHPRMHNLLLQIMEDGTLTDSKGKSVSFERTFVILTSNVGAEEMVARGKALGFDREPTLGRASLQDITSEALDRTFSPEFLGRLDETILFGELDLDSARKIARSQLTGLAARARSRGFKAAFTPAVSRWIAERGFSPQFGARELRRVIQREIESRLSLILLEGLEQHCGSLVRVRITNDSPVFDWED